jgi:hypothetical protein
MSRLEQFLAGTLVMIALLVLAAAGGHHFGAAGVQADWDRDKLVRAGAQTRAVAAAIAENEKTRQQDLAAARTTIANYERKLHEADDRITAERAAADQQRLRITVPARVCPAAPGGEAAGAGRTDAAGAVETVELPAAVEQGLRDLVEDADREVARLGAKVDGLQNWIRTHGFFGPVP